MNLEKQCNIIKNSGDTDIQKSYEYESLFEDYDKDSDGNPISCCGDILEVESGFRCKSCGENC